MASGALASLLFALPSYVAEEISPTPGLPRLIIMDNLHVDALASARESHTRRVSVLSAAVADCHPLRG